MRENIKLKDSRQKRLRGDEMGEVEEVCVPEECG